MSDTSTINSQGPLLTNDGVPLKDSLKKNLYVAQRFALFY